MTRAPTGYGIARGSPSMRCGGGGEGARGHVRSGAVAAHPQGARAQPRHLRRAVLRPGVRLRDHAALARPARALHARAACWRPRSCFWPCGGCGSTPPGSPTGSIPTAAPVRLMLFALMLAGLVLSTSIPKAFEEPRASPSPAPTSSCRSGAASSCCGRSRTRAPATIATSSASPAWLVLSGVFWIAGGLANGEWRLGLWLAALAIEYVSPSVYFWTPGLGRSTTADWDVEGAAHGRALRALHHHRARRVDPRHRRHVRRPALDGRDGRRLSRRLRRQRRHVVDLFQHRRRARQPAHRRLRAIPAAWRASPTPTCTCRSSPASSSPPSATSWCSPIPPATPTPKTAAVLIGAPALYLVGNLDVQARHRQQPGAVAHGRAGFACRAGPAVAVRWNHLTLSAATTLVLVVVAAWETLSLQPHRGDHSAPGV